MERADLLERKELQNYKFNRELNLYDRRVNMTAHCFSHKCGDYCWREKVMETLDHILISGDLETIS